MEKKPEKPVSGEAGEDHPKKPRGNPANLQPPWPKGKSANPGGRPKGQSLLKILRKMLKNPATSLVKPDISTMTVAEFLIVQALVHAGKGKSAYFREIVGQLYGRPAIRIEHTHADGESADQPSHVIEAGLMAMMKAIEEGGNGGGSTPAD